MKIVVLDGYTMNPGDLSWEDLRRVGPCDLYDRTTPDAVVERSAGAGIVLTNKVVLDRAVIERLPDLKYIGVLATGYNVVDMQAARERNIVVTHVPAYSTMSVAQMVFALLLEMTQHIGRHSGRVRQGAWSASPDFCFWERPLIELDGLTMGIVGFGRIGRAVARIAQAFGMNVRVHTRCPEKALQDEMLKSVRFVDADTLFSESDVISLHCPLTDQTRVIINARTLAMMKPTAFLINTGRGPLIDEQALADALNAGRIAGAGMDVLSAEPPPPDNPLLEAKHCFISPHVAWATKAARQRLMDTAVANIKAFLDGSAVNVVS